MRRARDHGDAREGQSSGLTARPVAQGSCVQIIQSGMEFAGCLVRVWRCRARDALSVPCLPAAATFSRLLWAVALGWKAGAGWTVVAGLPHSCGLIHTETWAGSRAWCTTPARSSRTESRSTVSFSRAANAATVGSAS